jgi:hypothetical protein
MRLLERNTAGAVRLTKDFLDDEIPQYAILSHTWGDEEVNYKDLMAVFKDRTDVFTFLPDNPDKKVGYEKIRFCGDQARQHGLRYFWVDTCCIDKSSSAELQKAICSMFRWYRDAERCYAYLVDVSRALSDDDNTNQLR